MRKLFSSPKSLIFLFLCGLLAISAVGLSACTRTQTDLLKEIRQRGKLIVGVKYDSKPFGYLDTDGTLKGYDIDLMRELARRMLGEGERVEFQQVFSSTRVIAIDSSNVDVVAATMTITPERAQKVDFSRPYFTAHQAVIVPADSGVKSLDDLNGKTVLYVMGTTGEANIKKRLPDAKYVGFKTSTDAFSALKARRGDAMTTDDTILSGFMEDSCGFRMLEQKLSSEPYGLGLRKNPQGNPLQSLMNRHLDAMEKDGTLARLKARWVDEALKPRACTR